MKGKVLVVGLGNPGPRYAFTRHNAGFLCVEEVARNLGIAFHPHRLKEALVAEGTFAGRPFLLVKPLSYMNLSGSVVAHFARAWDAAGEDLWVIHDDMDLFPGTIRLKRGGGSGGHRGIASVLAALGEDFARLRIGIGRPPEGVAVVDWVLSSPEGEEARIFREGIVRGAQALLAVYEIGWEEAMNRFHRRS
ncbi:MAG: aminoacyl-tRNA hydrolase [Bacillota bacterium]|nr:aminoacyl-tRNA hydrolase [Bacillota bacterium]